MDWMAMLPYLVRALLLVASSIATQHGQGEAGAALLGAAGLVPSKKS